MINVDSDDSPGVKNSDLSEVGLSGSWETQACQGAAVAMAD